MQRSRPTPHDAGLAVDAVSEVDSGTEVDAEGAAPPAGPEVPGGVICGPNRCWTAEVCCGPRCGICALAGECFPFDCPGPR